MSWLTDIFGGGSQSDQQRQQQGYNSGYAAYTPGSSLPEGFKAGESNLSMGYDAGFRAAGSDYSAKQDMNAMWAEFFAGMGGGDEGPSYETQLADQQALYEKQLADAQRIQGLNDRDTLFSSYMDAAGSATDYVNSEINTEQSNANLLGIDYSITDEQKTTRISDYFATLWGEGEQTQLEGLISQWGDPTGFTGFSVQRGDGSQYAAQETPSETIATSTGAKPIAPQADEEVLGSKSSILGA